VKIRLFRKRYSLLSNMGTNDKKNHLRKTPIPKKRKYRKVNKSGKKKQRGARRSIRPGPVHFCVPVKKGKVSYQQSALRAREKKRNNRFETIQGNGEIGVNPLSGTNLLKLAPCFFERSRRPKGAYEVMAGEVGREKFKGKRENQKGRGFGVSSPKGYPFAYPDGNLGGS